MASKLVLFNIAPNSAMNYIQYNTCMNTIFLTKCPRSHCTRTIFIFKPYRAHIAWGKFHPPCILPLLLSGRPSTIAGFVVATIVDAVNRISRSWAWSHIFKKRREIMQPSVADNNAPATVIRPIGRSSVVTSPFHIFPRHIFGCALCSMFEESSPCQFFLETTT